ncbi:hypothetical protein R5R35_012585 [Gryllus longicercus]|uniref:Hormone-sensitive lipase n=1 Tax=Gryllus longicercus TaxID=2509291 RepID=A0AAN9Z806_9ORTH
MATEGEQQGEKRKPSPVLSMYQMLKDLCQNNAEHFRGDDTENGQRLHAGFLAIIDHVNTVTPLVEEIRSIAPYFDFDETTPGNGYRSFVVVVDKCIQHGIKLCRQVIDGRDSFLFRKGTYMREVEACSHVLASLGTCMQHLKTLLAWSRMGELFPSGEHSSEELLKQAESINMYCFYGRCLGFQFCESMQTVLKTISICMASFSEIYYGNGGIFSKATNSVWTGGKYLLDPELRARRIVNISQHAQVDFCKSFWLLAESELMSHLPGMICPAVAVNIVIQIPPEPLEMATLDGGRIQVPIPSAHIGPGPVPVRLLCATRREGMVGKAKAGAISCAGSSSNGAGAGGSLPPPSPCLLLHVHGGGFVAQSSRSHETYLRDWAVRLGVPIISVDYSLAPRAPYPRALEEVFYAYCWALKNCRLLGSTAEQIILIGDSAGGNLNLAVTMKCIEMGIRQPSALFLAYVPVLVSFVPSPSRLLCLMDPLLPFGFMIRCLKAYACPTPHNSEAEESSTATDLTKDPVTSHSSTKNSLAMASSMSNNTLDNTLSLTAGGHKKKCSPNGHLPGSETESFEEVSESDLLELAAHKSPMSELGSDTLTTVSLASLQSRPEADLPLRLSDMALKTPDTIDGQGTSSGATPTVTETAETPKAITQDEQSEKYVADFLEKYVLDTETDSEGRKIPVLREANEAVLGESDEHVLFELPPVDLGLSARLGRAAGNIASGVTSTFLYMTGQKSPSSERTPTNEPIGKRKLSNGSDPPLEMSALDTLMQRSPSEEFQFTVPRDPFLSPYWADDEILKQLPPINLLSVQMDPCLDDCVMFAKKLKGLGNTVHLDILEGLPHGFLNFVLVSKDAHCGSTLCVKRIQELIDSLGKPEES